MTGFGLVRTLLRRLLLWLGALVVVFCATALLPGDPVRLALGPAASPAEVAARRAALGLDRPLPVRLVDWLGGLATGDLGQTVRGQPIGPLLAGALPWTAMIVIPALLLTVTFSILGGVWWATHPRRLGARAVGHTSATLIALPEFVIGGLLIIVFALLLDALPAVTVLDLDGRIGAWDMLVLPILTLALPQVAWQVRIVRAAVAEAYELPHVTQAQLDGLSTPVLIFRHLLPVTAPTLLASLATAVGGMLGATVVVETLFNQPGVGQLLAASVEGRDPALASAVVAFSAGLVMIVMLAADLCRDWAVRGRR